MNNKSLLGIALMWPVAMAWHLWRIGTGRPAFEQMSDTKPMAISFGAVYFVAGMVRWTVDARHSALVNLFGLVLGALIVLFIAERSNRSSSLVAAILGASAIVDLVMTAAYMTPLQTWCPCVLEIALYAICWAKFFRCPPEVQARGYRYRPAATSSV